VKWISAILVLLIGCASSDLAQEEDDVRVDTRSKLARAQYDANVAFANSYVPRCTPGSGPRVLVTGFGRFMDIEDNATGRIVSELVRQARYPETSPPEAGQIDPPAPQLSVGRSTIVLPKSGSVQVCAMILPVYWDLAAVLIAKEAEAFAPDMILMNGVAGAAQPLWFEMGSLNRAQASMDGSDLLSPIPRVGQQEAKLVESDSESSRALYAPWKEMQAAAESAIEAESSVKEGNKRFGQVLQGTRLAGFPRSSNTYLCNNVTYVTNYLLDHPGESIPLLQASKPIANRLNEVRVTMRGDYRKTVREFLHWPSTLQGNHVRSARNVLLEVIDAALVANTQGKSKRGDNALAAPDMRGGDTF
jgi:pyrrolidone-carboxylate peptidase